MAQSRGNRQFYNLIWITVLTVLLLLSMLGSNSISSVALEQEVRCGFEEHSHVSGCYMEGVLLCTRKAHVHSENCYLVLLKDNDINQLLQTVNSTPAKSLEGVIDSVLVQALTLNEDFADAAPPLQLDADQVSSLNDTITENRLAPVIVLNEHLKANTTLAYAPSGGASTLAVGDSPNTGTRRINFYMVLDGKITFVSSGTLTNSNPDYYSYSGAAGAYTQYVITNLNASNINNGYHFRYNTSGTTSQTSSFTSNATYNRWYSRAQFGNSGNARYALLVNSSYQPINFYTVKLDYSQSGSSKEPEIQYVESGLASTLSLSEEYLWYDAQGNAVTALPAAITQTTTLYARPKAFTAAFVDPGGAQLAEPYSGQPTNGSLSVTLPSLSGTAYDGGYWIVQGSDGATYYSEGTAVSITEDTVFQAVPGKYTLTFRDANGNQTTQTVGYRQTVTLGDLPAGQYWYDSSGNRYAPGASYGPVTQSMTFTAATQMLNVTYRVNFPAGATGSVDSVPTIYGTNAATVTDSVPSSGSTAARALTSRTARREVSSGNKESVTYFFKGWTIDGTAILIQPDTVMSGQMLAAYADANQNVTLTGLWEEGGRYNSATFFVRFDSQAVDTEGNITSQPTSNYTPEVFNTHVGGVDISWGDANIKKAYEIADSTSDNSVSADREIRALYGEKSEGLWLYDFPKDDDVFAYLKEYLKNNPNRQLTVDGITVDPAELDSTHYAIRWYVFKLEGSTWHADGKLVRKVGTITVDKTFGGEEAAISQAENGFYIFAENGTKNADGTFVPHPTTHSNFQQVVMVLDQATANRLKSTYPLAQFHIVDTQDLLNDDFEWVITNVELGEYWHITEYPTDVPGYSYYAEYSVYDTDGEYSAIAEYGTNASVMGKTFALDEDPDQGLMVDFANYYYPIDSILLKKEDATTGHGIAGAIFEIWQNGRPLKFDYDAVTGIYSQNPDGATTQIQSGSGGFATIAGFSYLHGDSTGDGHRDGDILIKEVIPPSGYNKAPDAELGLDSQGNVILKDVSGISQAEWSKHAAVPSNEVAVIRDHVSDYVSVTAQKIWNTNTPADSVEVVLQANGSHAAALFPGMTNAQVKLTAGNYWSYTWSNLPRYANGKEVVWSIKEVVIGNAPTLSDGTSFANWIATYAPGVGADTDSDGDTDHWTFTVTNTIRRPQLIVTKIGSDNMALANARFRLEQVTLSGGLWKATGGMDVTLTTNAQGMLTFDQLIAGAYYRLTEAHPPDGYIGMEESVVLTVNGEGLVQLVNADGTSADLVHGYITHTGPYNIQVQNLKLTPLPETGGVGTTVYTQSGLLLMLAALALLIYKSRRKEERDSS